MNDLREVKIEKCIIKGGYYKKGRFFESLKECNFDLIDEDEIILNGGKVYNTKLNPSFAGIKLFPVRDEGEIDYEYSLLRDAVSLSGGISFGFGTPIYKFERLR